MLRRLFLLGLGLLLAACATTAPTGPATGKRIALTFDDTPRSAGPFLTPDQRAARLRAGLRRAGVEQAAFFVNPGSIAERPSGLQHILEYAADGHVIANHSNTHPQLSDTPTADYIADIEAAEEWLKKVPGHRPWFRYPFLDEGRKDKAKRDAVRAALARNGLRNGYVTVDASDWYYEGRAGAALRNDEELDMDALRDLYVESHVQSANFADALARKTFGRAPAHVMLLHETDLAAFYIVDLVEALEAKGWTIVTADEAYDDPIGRFAGSYDTPSAQGTLLEMVAWERGLPAPRWYARNDTRLAGEEFDRRVLHKSPAPVAQEQ